MKKLTTTFVGVMALAAGAFMGGTTAKADHTITIRIGSGHPPTVVYAGLMKNFFQPELKKAIEAKTSHKVKYIEGYSGSIVKVFDVFEGVQNGVLDIGGFCYCFEASKLPMHAFQIMLPFGTMDPVQSVAIANKIYKKFPRLKSHFQKYDQTLLAIIGDGGYNLGTNFPWKTTADLKGHKILGAGLNLNWMKQAGMGIIAVTDGLPGWYQKIKTGVAEGGIMFPSAWGPVFKLHEVGAYYTSIGIGSITWHALNVNNRFWNSLPAEVKPIVLDPEEQKKLDELKKALAELATEENANVKLAEQVKNDLGALAKQAEENPLVPPQVRHFRQVPLRTRVKFPHSLQASPS